MLKIIFVVVSLFVSAFAFADVEALQKVAAATVSGEALSLYNDAPSGSKAKEIYFARWVELANIEAPQKVAAVTTSGEALSLYNGAPFGSKAKEIYFDRWIELENLASKN